MLAASCGKDIDDNCRGVNLDATRLRECLNRNQDVVSAKCKADYPHGPRRHPAAHYRAHLAGKTLQLGIEQALRRGASRSRQGPAMPAGIHQEGDPELQQGDHRCGVSLMRSVKRRMRDIGLLLGALSVLAWPTAAARAQSATSTADIIEKLAVRRRSGYRPGRLAPAGSRTDQGEGGSPAAKAAADRAATVETAANPFRHRVRPGLLPDPAGLLPDHRQHRRCADRSEIAALPLSDRRSRRIRRPARPQSDPEPAARRIRSGMCW